MASVLKYDVAKWEKLPKFIKEPEIVLVLIFLPLLIEGRFFAEQFVVPGKGGSIFAFNHYLFPILVSMGVLAVILGRLDRKGTALMGLLCVFTIFAHFNFKSWSILSGRNYDRQLHLIDSSLGINSLSLSVRTFIANHIGFNVDFLYHDLFVFLFFATMILVAIRAGMEGARRANFCICLVLLAGGVAYSFFPAIGPFIFGQKAAVNSSMSQFGMIMAYSYIQKNGCFPPGFFIQGLAAMPSLHLGHATVFLCFSIKYAKWLAPLFLLCFFWFFIESMASGWHYFADIPAGILIGLAAFQISEKINWPKDSPRKKADASAPSTKAISEV